MHRSLFTDIRYLYFERSLLLRLLYCFTVILCHVFCCSIENNCGTVVRHSHSSVAGPYSFCFQSSLNYFILHFPLSFSLNISLSLREMTQRYSLSFTFLVNSAWSDVTKILILSFQWLMADVALECKSCIHRVDNSFFCLFVVFWGVAFQGGGGAIRLKPFLIVLWTTKVLIWQGLSPHMTGAFNTERIYNSFMLCICLKFIEISHIIYIYSCAK